MVKCVAAGGIKGYQQVLSEYLRYRREGDHFKAAEAALLIANFWASRRNYTRESMKWHVVFDFHMSKLGNEDVLKLKEKVV